MEKAEVYAKAIRAGMAFTGMNQQELADRIGITRETLNKRLSRPGELKLNELISADKAIRWTAFLEGMK